MIRESAGIGLAARQVENIEAVHKAAAEQPESSPIGPAVRRVSK
jgi:hypothetical protein